MHKGDTAQGYHVVYLKVSSAVKWPHKEKDSQEYIGNLYNPPNGVK